MKKSLNCYIAILLIATLFAPSVASSASTGEILNLSDEISSNKDKLEKLEENLDYYKKKIDDTRKQSVTLKNQIDLINNHVKKTELEVQSAELKIDQLELEILKINDEIKNAKIKIELQKELIAYYLREFQRLSGKSQLEILLLHRSFSTFFNELQYLQNLQDNLNASLKSLQDISANLENKQNELKDKREAELQEKNNLEERQATLESQKTAKTFLIGQTFASESKFQALLYEAKKEQEELDREIGRLESEIREKLKQNDLFPYGGSIVLSWPITKNKITAYFHDPDYPYRYVYEHAGIDVRAQQGTTIKAPAPGYVLKVRNQNGWRDYNYVVLVHAGGISTVYIHLSQVYVKPDTYVSRGQVIGLTGGTPRTRGAGYFTTGPHLHFEVRMNGIPVNPLDYLVNL
ncbi:peptidoglycan DD-metalloendopeptidase family protein [Patescibacteria group bacterium]|nr:peptidoglycan DD-metalloendopeptidase family protein [Patescibacteria group bacterium]